jgi:ubiquinone/menaquinone biosynthesis C-methylase UbiE
MIDEDKMVRLNLGSGPSSAKGWINYDWGLLPLLGRLGLNKWLGGGYNTKWVEVKLHNLKNRFKENNDVADYIYCSHVLEHFEKYESLKILKECQRLLKSGGKLRVVLPDLDKVKEIKDPEVFNRVYFGFDKDKFGGWKNRIKVWFIRPHQWMYTADSFCKMLEEAGFQKYELKSFGVGNVPDLGELDLEIHKPLSFYVEAEK